MKLMVKFYLCLHNFSEIWILFFLSFPREIVFGVISGNYLNLKLLENAKRTVICLQTFWNKVFVQLKLKLVDFLSDFVLIIIVELINDWIWLRRLYCMLNSMERFHVTSSSFKIQI